MSSIRKLKKELRELDGRLDAIEQIIPEEDINIAGSAYIARKLEIYGNYFGLKKNHAKQFYNGRQSSIDDYE